MEDFRTLQLGARNRFRKMKIIPKKGIKNGKGMMKQTRAIITLVAILMALWDGVAHGNQEQSEPGSVVEEKPTQISGKLFLKRVILSGTTVLEEDEVAEIVQDYLNREVSFWELQKIQESLTQAYVKEGYANSTVVLLSQKITQGVVQYQAIEGTAQLEIKGTKTLKKYITRRLKPFLGPPFNQNVLLERLKILSQNPKLSKIQANLSSTGEIGKGILTVEVIEAPAWQMGVSLNNFENPLIGDYGGEVELVNQNIWGNGDSSFKLLYKRTEGLERFLSVYRLELAPNGSSLQLAYQESDSEIVEGILSPFEVKNEAFTASLSYNQYLVKTANDSVTLDLEIERRESRGTVLERRLFSEPQLTVGRLGLSYLRRSPEEFLYLTTQMSAGGSSVEIDPTFFSWKAQGQVIKAVSEDFQIFGRLAVHLSPHVLPGGEKCALGGKNGNVFIFGNTVRGYGTNFISDDNCIASTVEARFWLLQAEKLSLQLLSFVDVGQPWSSRQGSLGNPTLVSTGLGLRFNWESLKIQLDYGRPLNPLSPADSEQLQPFSLSVEGHWKF